MIFNGDTDAGFTKKEIFVVDGHKFKTPPSMPQNLVVSRDSVHIVLMLAALNNLDAKCANAQNAFLTDNLKESVLLWNGQEFGVHKRKVVVIVRALNGVMDARYA